MPESKPRKRAAKKKAAKKPERTPLTPVEVSAQRAKDRTQARKQAQDAGKKRRDPYKEIPEDKRHKITKLPDPATRDQLLVALSKLDPLAQEVMIAQRISTFRHPHTGDPVNINRNVRAPWAHDLRKLGIFCVPELATHELVAPDGTGTMINHTGSTIQGIDRGDLWEYAKQQNPKLAEMVDNAHTPAEKRKAMRILAAKLPVEQRVALEKLMAVSPEDLEPI